MKYVIICTSEFENGEYVYSWYKTKKDALVDFKSLKMEANINSVSLYKVEEVT